MYNPGIMYVIILALAFLIINQSLSKLDQKDDLKLDLKKNKNNLYQDTFLPRYRPKPIGMYVINCCTAKKFGQFFRQSQVRIDRYQEGTGG